MKTGLLVFFMLLITAVKAQDQESPRELPSLENGSFQLYPNPSVDGYVHIATATHGIKHIVVYDVFGEIVLTDRITGKTLNISRLVAGVYVLQVTENNNTMTRKLVVK